MFGSNKNTEEVKTTPTSTPNALNALAKGTVVEGSIRCDNDLRIDGTIKGKLSCQAKVIIVPPGSVEGEIRCQNAVIEGRYKGTLQVSELLNVRETAEIDGEIITNKLLVHSGARFNVTCNMETGAANGIAKNADVKPAGNASATSTPVAGGKAEVRN